MRLISAFLIGTLLLTACGGNGNSPADVPTEVPTIIPAANTPTRVTATEMTTTTEMTDSTSMTDSIGMTDAIDMTDTGAMGITNTGAMTENVNVTETPGITPSEQLTATGAAGLLGIATLQNVDGEFVGNAVFTQNGDEVTLQVTVDGFTAAGEGVHGIHIHTVGACTPDFDAAGSHFNPTTAQHGLDNPSGPHAGDLPNLEIDADGNGSYEATTTMVALAQGDNSLFDSDGSALVIHADPDDLVTDPAGNSGDRIACGVIEQQS